ncbi:MAG: hypothetical protein NT094_04665, partial [Candidatus Staskawiczbacteria bacterium]|nr:hypothetical protein [Candidatus Staskawiczbacteria bacterium]
MPFFSLYDADVKNRTRTEYRIKAKRGNEELEVVWIVSSNPEYGYPGPFDRMLHKAIEQIISELQTSIQNPISIGSF